MKKKIKKWLKKEIENDQAILDSPEPFCEISDGTEDIIHGRLECANGLLEMIEEWEKEKTEEGYPIWWIDDVDDLKSAYKCKRQDYVYDDGDTKILELAWTGDDGPINTGQNCLVEVTNPNWERVRYGFMVGLDLQPEYFSNTISEREVNNDNTLS